MVRVGRHRLCDAARRAQSEKRRELEQTPHVSTAVVDRPVSSPSRAMRRRDAESGLARVLDRLPAPYREVLVAVRLEHRRTADVAERLGLSPAAVRKRLERALHLCREIGESDSFAAWR